MTPSAPDIARLRAALRASLKPPAGQEADAVCVTGIVLGMLQQMTDRLVPVIGISGMDALYYRSLHLSSAAFPWLVVASERSSPGIPFPSLKKCLEAHAADIAAEAGYTLLATLVELLAGLIGESLTRRLLRPVWAVTPEKIQENDHEQ